MKKYAYFSLIILGFLGFLSYFNIQKRSLNEDFSFDVIRSLNEIYRIRDSDTNMINHFESAYFMKEQTLNAKNIMGKWESDNDQFRKKIYTPIMDGINDLLIASDTYIDLAKNNSPEESLSLFKVKLEEGRKNLMLGASGLVLEDKGIQLTKNQKQNIINYIESAFEDELTTYKKSNKDKNFNQPEEIWAIIIIRNGLLEK
ncbi:MAG: hypothetical protein K9M36_03190 [Candidatus Pacebacteria bacterium]|nr:hypothetical protein [Candidatus Paceibacterota bacterium]